MSENNFVSNYYVMDPKTEDLASSGRKLKDGMVVLIEDFLVRGNPEHALVDDEEQNRVLESNRWCKVTELTYEGHLVRFIGVYEDGTKRQRRYDVSYAWLYKLDPSIFEPVLYPEFVKSTYVMDPETEKLIAKGSQLKDGMKVFVQGFMGLTSLSRPLNDSEYYRALQDSRWCTVSELEITERYEDGYDYDYDARYDSSRVGRKMSSLISFIGVYEDGTKFKRSYDDSFSWLVKKDSLPEPPKRTRSEVKPGEKYWCDFCTAYHTRLKDSTLGIN